MKVTHDAVSRLWTHGMGGPGRHPYFKSSMGIGWVRYTGEFSTEASFFPQHGSTEEQLKETTGQPALASKIIELVTSSQELPAGRPSELANTDLKLILKISHQPVSNQPLLIWLQTKGGI